MNSDGGTSRAPTKGSGRTPDAVDSRRRHASYRSALIPGVAARGSGPTWTRKRSAQVLLWRRLSNRVVVAIEQPTKLFAKGLVIRKKRTQHKRLEKPGCMRLMPLHRTSLRAGLHHLILSGGSCCEREGHRSHGCISGAKTAICLFPVRSVPCQRSMQ